MANNGKKSGKEQRLKQQAKNNKNQCPLSDPSIGIISENDHRVGLCLCRYCDCGTHKCYKETINFYPKSTFSTKYQHDYQKNQFDVPLKVEQTRYRPNTAKMDLTTTNQIEYKQCPPTPEVSKSISLSPHKKEITKITAYASDYPDWGPIKVNYEKR